MGDRPSLGDPPSPLRVGIKSHTICESIVHLSYEEITHLGYALCPPRYYNPDIVKPGAL
jgi:hypothetical protein